MPDCDDVWNDVYLTCMENSKNYVACKAQADQAQEDCEEDDGNDGDVPEGVARRHSLAWLYSHFDTISSGKSAITKADVLAALKERRKPLA